MKPPWLISLGIAFCGVMLMAEAAQPAEPGMDIDLTQWAPSDISGVGEDPFGTLAKYGYDLFTNTAMRSGPLCLIPRDVLLGTISPAQIAICRPGHNRTPCR